MDSSSYLICSVARNVGDIISDRVITRYRGIDRAGVNHDQACNVSIEIVSRGGAGISVGGTLSSRNGVWPYKRNNRRYGVHYQRLDERKQSNAVRVGRPNCRKWIDHHPLGGRYIQLR